MKRIILLVLTNVWMAANLFSMDKPAKTVPISSDMKLISDAVAQRLLVNDQELKQFLQKAEDENSDVQYQLANFFYYGLTSPEMQPNLKEAEHRFLKARKNGDLRAFLMLIELAEKQGDIQKSINYIHDAINRGFLDQYFYLGQKYLTQKKYKKMQEAFEKSIESLKDYQNNSYFKLISDLAQIKLASLSIKGIIKYHDIKKSFEILDSLVQQNNIHAMFALALIYLEGTSDSTRDIEKARKLLSKIESLGKPTVFLHIYYKTMRLLGEIYEKEPYKNFKKAVEYYQQAGSIGQFQIARLILTKKIAGNLEPSQKKITRSSISEES